MLDALQLVNYSSCDISNFEICNFEVEQAAERIVESPFCSVLHFHLFSFLRNA
jgi:hypothetical protein